jgi:hypothetical protein
MLLELARHDELAWRIDFGELTTATIGATVRKNDGDTHWPQTRRSAFQSVWR